MSNMTTDVADMAGEIVRMINENNRKGVPIDVIAAALRVATVVYEAELTRQAVAASLYRNLNK